MYNNWILGEPDKPDKCHYSQWFSYTRETSLGNQVTKTIYTLVITVLSSPLFVGIPQNHVKVVTILGGEGDLFLLQSLQLSRRSSWWLGLWRPNVSFCLFLVEVPEPSEADVEINETCWLLHYKQHVRPPGQIVTQKIMANCHTQPSWNEYSASHWSDIYHTAYNSEIFLFPLLIIVATYIRIYTLLSRCSENNFLS